MTIECVNSAECAGEGGGRSARRAGRGDGVARRWRAFTGLSIISFLGCIDLTIVNTAAPAVQRDMGATVTELQLIVNVFIVALSMFMVTMGRLADRYGRRRVLYTGTAVFGVASLAAGFAGDVRTLILCRFVQGAACAVLYTSTGALVSDTFPPQQRGRAIGALYGVNGLGLAIGPMLGGLLVGWLDWRWVFWLNVPLTAIGLAVCLSAVRESREHSAAAGKPDWPGLTLISLALPALVLALTLGDAWGWTSVRILGLLALGIAGVVAFCVVERKVTAPIVDFRLFGNRTFLGALTADFSLAFFYCLAFFLMPLYLVSVRHYGSTASGLMLLPCTAVMALLSPVVGRLVDRVPPRLLLCAGFVAFALSAALQAQFTRDSHVAFVAAAFALMGIGWAFVLGPATVAALSAVPERLAGTAVGSSWTFHNLGGAIGLAVGMAVYRWSARDALDAALAARHVPGGEWAARAVADPGAGAELLRAHTGWDGRDVEALAGDLFLRGNQAAMWLLCGVAGAAFLAIGAGMRARRGTPGAKSADAVAG
ncbi:drug resistance transporter, EmrB/QacA subfamily [Streptomyces yunnanensis]|uniref:Drug resistance transporter, EmrB/QacA subfamily n=1 Tax=Streptomyces yunnanensis TaxID=156453 RepID=A0A9X8N9J5_9ACTN|nr:drug resistance transporter, EmrB/QacA subfamily [Streptomyces yunnanensis]